jgi:subtilase family serine protease
MAQQAVAEGITWVASTGDSGAACAVQNLTEPAVNVVGVAVPSTVPEVTAIGGTTFVEGTGRTGPRRPMMMGLQHCPSFPRRSGTTALSTKRPSAVAAAAVLSTLALPGRLHRGCPTITPATFPIWLLPRPPITTPT